MSPNLSSAFCAVSPLSASPAGGLFSAVKLYPAGQKAKLHGTPEGVPVVCPFSGHQWPQP